MRNRSRTLATTDDVPGVVHPTVQYSTVQIYYHLLYQTLVVLLNTRRAPHSVLV